MAAGGTIIMPIAGRSSRFPGLRPKWMLSAPNGRLMLELSLSSVAEWADHRIVIGALKEHLDGLGGRGAIERALGSSVEIVEFKETTRGPAETVAMMIEETDIDGPIFIKDCDSWFRSDELLFDDIIVVADLRSLPWLRNVAAKSFVRVTENEMVCGITEKSVSSNFISLGGYGFRDATMFVESFERLTSQAYGGEPYISHVMLEAMHGGTAFKAVVGQKYEDVGTLEAWNAYRSRQSTYFVDLDGVVLKNAGQYLPPLWDDDDEPLPRNVEALRRAQDRGAQIVFLTARPERYRTKTEIALRQLGLDWHCIIFGLSHSSRILINDYASSNPYPSASALNLTRNGDTLDQFLRFED